MCVVVERDYGNVHDLCGAGLEIFAVDNETGYILVHAAEDVCNFACYSSDAIDISCW